MQTDWYKAGYESEFQYNDRLEANEWKESLVGGGLETRRGFTADGERTTEYRVGDQVFTDWDAAYDARSEHIKAEQAKVNEQTDWYQAGYSSQHRYDNRIDADPWETSGSGSWSSRSGWTPEGLSLIHI